MANLVGAPLILILVFGLGSSLACTYCPQPTTPSPPPPKACPPPPPPKPKPCPPPPGGAGVPATPGSSSCPIDALKLDACVDVLGGLVHAVVGRSTTDVCCPVLGGLVDLDAALCLCTTIRAKVLNINVVLPIALQLLIDCGKRVPSDYQCPA